MQKLTGKRRDFAHLTRHLILFFVFLMRIFFQRCISIRVVSSIYGKSASLRAYGMQMSYDCTYIVYYYNSY
jgi:hypothetical protein